MLEFSHFEDQAAAQQEGVAANKYAQRDGSVSSDRPGIDSKDSGKFTAIYELLPPFQNIRHNHP